MRAIELADARRHLAARPFAHRLLEQALLVGEVEVQHQRGRRSGGASTGFRNSTSRRLALQQELLGDAQRLEHALDVAVRERPLLAARRRYGRCCRWSDRPRRAACRSGAAPACGSAVRRTPAARRPGCRMRVSCSASALRRVLVEIVEEIPAQDAVDALVCLRKPLATNAAAGRRACLRGRADRCPSTSPRR